MNFTKIENVIDEITNFEIFEDLSYYTFHLGFPLWRLFEGKWSGVPYYLQAICDETSEILNQSEVSLDEVLLYLANSNSDASYFYVCRNLLATNSGIELSESEIVDILSNRKKLPKEVLIDKEEVSCAVVAYTLDTNRFNKWDFREILPREKFQYKITDYKLTKVTGVEFCPDGLIYDDKYYLYNIFIKRKKKGYFDKMPATFKVLSEYISLNRADFYLRLDERLAIPHSEAIITDRLLSEKFRGLQFNFNDTRLEKKKNIIVHGDLETFDKLLMVIKEDYDEDLNEEFWHIELEELPYMENKIRDIVCVTFLHGKYYPNQRVFKHMDFTKNQYNYSDYQKKYLDTSNSDTKIDFYTTKEWHYKIWCVENIDISEEAWYKVSNVTLGPVYRKLYDEIMESTLN